MLIHIHKWLIRSGEDYGLAARGTVIVAYFPIVVVALFTVGLVLRPARSATIWMLEEAHPVEFLTFVVFIIAAVACLRLAWQVHKRGESTLVRLFYALFALALFVVGMEEIAWGQKLFGFEIPESVRSANQQREMTLHNLPGLHGKNVFLRIAFGLGGLLGVAAASVPFLSRIATPAPLAPGLVVILLLALLDMACNYCPMRQPLDFLTSRLSEVVELIIAITALFYVILNARLLRKH